MKRYIPCLFLLFLLIVSCRQKAASDDHSFVVEVYKPACASGFSIWGAEGQKSTIIEVTDPWQSANRVTMRYFVARNGELPPEGFDGVVVPAGAHRIVCMSSSYVGMLDALSEASRIVGVSGLEFISSAYVTAHKDSIRDVGAELDFEILLGLKPELVLLYGVNDAQAAITDKLNELSIPYMYVGEYLEEKPLGRAEWLVALAEVLDVRHKAELLFTEIRQRYDDCRSLVAGVKNRPSVMLNTPWNDSWAMPADCSYMVNLLQDAGADYVFRGKSKTSLSQIGMETAYVLLTKADYWLNIGACTTMRELVDMDSHFSDAKAVKNHRVYNNNRRLTPGKGNDFWESSVVYPDRILKDLIHIFHPEKLTEADTLYYYRHLE